MKYMKKEYMEKEGEHGHSFALKFRGCSSDGCYLTTLYKSETTDTLFSFDPVISEVYSADYLFSICPT